MHDLDLQLDKRIAGGIREAIAEERFLVYLQPIVALATGEPDRHEALVRMLRIDGETILPGAFLATAERFGLTPEIDRFVLNTLLAELRDDPFLRVSVNLSAASFADDELLDWIETELGHARFAPEQLGFEITEATAMRDVSRATARLGTIAGLGSPIALDDFDAGLSSLSDLRGLPLSFVKIDGAAVGDLVGDPAGVVIASAVTDIAEAVGKQVIVERVENELVAAAVAGFGAAFGQGYHWGAPAPYLFGRAGARARRSRF